MKTPAFQWNKLASPREMVLWIACLTLIVMVSVNGFVLPPSQQIGPVQNELKTKQTELEALNKIIASHLKAQSLSSSPRQNWEALSRKVKLVFEKSNLTPDLAVSEVLNHLTQFEYAQETHLEKFALSGETKKEGYSEIKLDLNLEGNYDGVANYLRILREQPYLLSIRSFSLKPSDQRTPDHVELLAKSVLFMGDKKVASPRMRGDNPSQTSDLPMTDEVTNSPHTPFAADSSPIAAWSLNQLKLTSTMSGVAKPTALINNHLFELGDQVGDFKLVEIHAKEVILKRGEIEQVLSISMNLESPSGSPLFQRRSEKNPEIFEAPKTQPKQEAPASLKENKELEKADPSSAQLQAPSSLEPSVPSNS